MKSLKFILKISVVIVFTLPSLANAVECISPNSSNLCPSTSSQYSGGFSPSVGYGGFGGGSCSTNNVPVIFIHGNADSALTWGTRATGVNGYPSNPNSIYQSFINAGYNDCELFGITYLSKTEQANPQSNYANPDKYKIIYNFIQSVLAYTGKDQVDIVAHSLGVSEIIATLDYYNAWSKIRRFVNIAGGLRGLQTCVYYGYANAVTTTCDSQNYLDSYIFGFYPSNTGSGDTSASALTLGYNAWTDYGNPLSQRDAPKYNPNVSFYTLSAGNQDEVECSTDASWNQCYATAKFNNYTNVIAQLNIGAGTNALQETFQWQYFSDLMQEMGGDSSNGVGHIQAAHISGNILVNMLQTNCTGLACASGYTYGPYSSY